MVIKNDNDIKLLREGGEKLARVLQIIVKTVRPGCTTRELDEVAEREIRRVGGKPSFKGYKTHGAKSAYPASLCVSVNDEIVHGIPGERILKEGDIVGLDIGMEYGGIFTDTATTVPVGKIDKVAQKLLRVTEEALAIGIGEVRAGNRLGDIGAAVQGYIEKNGFGVVRELVGHGVGRAVHEEPEIPNWGKRGTGRVLEAGMVLALEPMATEKSPAIKMGKDGWTWLTRDGSRSAHFEHTVLITKNGAEIITQSKY